MENKFEIVRSFSKTVQIRPYEPESYFCSVKQGFEEAPTVQEIKTVSALLTTLAKEEVMKSVDESLKAEEDKNTIQEGLDSVEPVIFENNNVGDPENLRLNREFVMLDRRDPNAELKFHIKEEKDPVKKLALQEELKTKTK